MLEFFILVLAGALSVFYRSLIAVIAPELALDLGLDETSLGTLASLFFIGFAAVQIPVGMALDRLGPRLTMALFMSAAIVGTGLFASANGPSLAYAGMTLIGIGCAPAFTGGMVVIGRRYGAEKFAIVTSLLLAMGNLGDLASTAPFASLTQWIGWRGALWVVLGCALITAMACLAFLGRDRQAEGTHPETFVELFMGTFRVMTLRGLWPILPLSLTGYATLMTLRGLWAGPYLADTFGLDPEGRGMVLLAMAIAMTVGMLGYGLIDRRLNRRKPLIAGGTSIVVLSCIGLVIWPNTSLILATLLLTSVGLFGYTYTVLMAHCRTFLPLQMMGRGIAFLTQTSMIGVGLLQWLSGLVMETTGSYVLMFGGLAATLSVAILIYTFSREGPQSPP